MHLIKIFNAAKKVLDDSKVISFPTETVMGLGVYYDDYNAYKLMNKIKGRPEDKPYTLMLSNTIDIDKYAFISKRDLKIINTFMPGPITVLLKSKDIVPDYVTHNTGIIGIRIPDIKLIQNLITYCHKPLLVPSANKSGMKPALTSKEVEMIFKDEVDYIIQGEAMGGIPSTIVDLTGEEVKIVREGPISLLDIENALLEVAK